MNPDIQNKIDSYPNEAQDLFCQLRALIFELAESHHLGPVEETLKWGEPAFLNKQGSTIRIDWKPKSPENIYLFFNCKTILVETFKEIFYGVFEFQGNRAIAIPIKKGLPKEIETCLLMALNYHKLKNQTLLGVNDTSV